jgi:hypothetical protein
VSDRLDEVGGTGETHKVDRYIARIAATITIDCMAPHMDNRDKVYRCIARVAATITFVLHGYRVMVAYKLNNPMIVLVDGREDELNVIDGQRGRREARRNDSVIAKRGSLL